MAGGRPLGSKDKNKAFLLNRLQAEYGEEFHPIMRMAANAHALQEVADNYQVQIEDAIDEIQEITRTAGAEWDQSEIEERDKATGRAKRLITRAVTALKEANGEWERIAPYIAPKLKQIDMDIQAVGMTHEEWLLSLREDEPDGA
jgi:hypothetical protein